MCDKPNLQLAFFFFFLNLKLISGTGDSVWEHLALPLEAEALWKKITQKQTNKQTCAWLLNPRPFTESNGPLKN